MARVYQGETLMGEIAGHHQAHDWSIIEDTGIELVFARDPWIWAGSTGRQIGSWVTKYGLSHFKSEKTTVYKQGMSTGETLGQITGLAGGHYKQCVSITNAVETNCNTAGGDSGGPMYIYEGDGQISLIGHSLYSIDPFPHGAVGEACNGINIYIYESNGGYPAWRLTKKRLWWSVRHPDMEPTINTANPGDK